MKKSAIIYIYIILLGMTLSCSPIRYVTISNTDTVTVQETVRDTLIKFQVEKEYIEVLTRDTSSTINAKYCASTAQISEGVLKHTLTQFPDSIPVRIQYVEKEVEKVSLKEVPVEVTKEVKYIPKWVYLYIIISIILTAVVIIIYIKK